MDELHIISSYSRAQAIEDGVLIDISATARTCGFKLHTVITAAAKAHAPRESDVFTLLVAGRNAIVRSSANASLVEFEREGIKYLLHIGPGDQGEPVLTLMLPSDW